MLGQLHFVTGKGGVGKSTVAAALALGLARKGQRVLALELSPPAGLSRLFGAPAARAGEHVPVDDRLFYTFFDGEAALAEYLHDTVRLGALLDVILAHPFYRAFVESAPGVRELMAIGKVRDELRQREGLARRWDAIVVDAGATGHALAHLRMPASAQATFRAGRVHREAGRITALLGDPAHTAVHVVALPEEMPLEEAGEVIERLRDLHIPLGLMVVNRCLEPAPPGTEGALDELRGLTLSDAHDEVRKGMEAAARRALGWLAIQEPGIAALEQRTGEHAVRLPRLVSASFGAEELLALSDALEGARR